MSAMNTRSLVALLVAGVLLMPTRGSASVAATPVATEVDTSGMRELPEHAEFVHEMLAKRAREGLDGLDVARPCDVVVRVEFLAGKQVGHYAYSVSTEYDGRELGDDAVAAKCELCTPHDLADRVGDAIAGQRAAIEREARVPAGDTDVGRTPPPPTARRDGDTTPPRTVPRWTALGKSGVGVASVGVVGIAVGVPLALQHDDLRNDVGDVAVKSTRRPGVAIAAVGGGLVAVGLAILIVDLARQRNARRKAAQRVPREGLVLRF